MGQTGSTLASAIIGYEVGRRIGLLDELICQFGDDERFINYQYIMQPHVPQKLKNKFDKFVIIQFFIILLWLFNQEPFVVSMILTSCLYAFSYDFCRYVKDTTVSGRVVNLLYNNGTLVWSLISGR